MVAVTALIATVPITPERISFVLPVFGNKIFLVENPGFIKLKSRIIISG
jgi:hypothetical protein